MAAAYLTQDWLEQYRALGAGLPPRPGLTARLAYVIGDGKADDVAYTVTLADGVVVAADAGAAPDADLLLAMKRDVSAKVLRGELDADAAFMQGKLKVTGSMGRYLSLLALTRSDEYRAMLAELGANTSF